MINHVPQGPILAMPLKKVRALIDSTDIIQPLGLLGLANKTNSKQSFVGVLG